MRKETKWDVQEKDPGPVSQINDKSPQCGACNRRKRKNAANPALNSMPFFGFVKVPDDRDGDWLNRQWSLQLQS